MLPTLESIKTSLIEWKSTKQSSLATNIAFAEQRVFRTAFKLVRSQSTHLRFGERIFYVIVLCNGSTRLQE
jgi:hypothetical protein